MKSITQVVQNLLKPYIDEQDGELSSEIQTLMAKQSDGETIALSDFIALESGVTATSSNIKKVNNHIHGYITFSGSATTTPSGRFKVGTIKSAYRPSMGLIMPSVYNPDQEGQVFASCNAIIGTSGAIELCISQSNTTIGNSSYSWATSNGFVIDYWL